jgi:hypothetical protein
MKDKRPELSFMERLNLAVKFTSCLSFYRRLVFGVLSSSCICTSVLLENKYKLRKRYRTPSKHLKCGENSFSCDSSLCQVDRSEHMLKLQLLICVVATSFDGFLSAPTAAEYERNIVFYGFKDS